MNAEQQLALALLRMMAVLEAIELRAANPRLTEEQVATLARRRVDNWLDEAG